jgi:hypothetical protein
MHLWVLLTFIATLVAVGFLARWLEKRYTKSWQRAAEELGLAYYGPQNDLLARFGHLFTLKRGRRQQVANAIAGVDGDLEVIVADFRYVTGSGKSTRRHTETLAIVHRPGLGLPACTLRPQVRLFDYLGKLFGGQDIDFPEDAEFSQAYVLKGNLPEAIRRMLGDAARAWLIERRAKNLHCETDRDTLVFHYSRKIRPEQARDLIAQALQIHTLLGSNAVNA